MRIDKLTTKFQEALQDAQSLAAGRDHQYIEGVHVLSALIAQNDGAARSLLARTGVHVQALQASLQEALGRLPEVKGNDGNLQVGRELSGLLNQADKEAQKGFCSRSPTTRARQPGLRASTVLRAKRSRQRFRPCAADSP